MTQNIRQRPGSPVTSHNLSDQRGFTLVEVLVALSMFLVIAAASMTMLVATSRTQARDIAYRQEIQTSQVGLARLVHDLREASAFVMPVQPGVIEFQMPISGTTYNVEYNCTAPDTLGPPYTRCARTQAVAPAAPPVATANANPPPTDIQHVWNNPANTAGLASGNDWGAFCNTTGTAPSGSVFYVQNPSTANPDGSTLVCDETYEDIVAKQPDYIQVRVQVPASGDQKNGGLKHFVVLQDGAYIQALDYGPAS
jgi:prepilin-type N-terminal cleavage/methylation domain-containing protein